MTSTQKSLIQTFFIVCLGAFIFLTFFNIIETSDDWWHLNTGRWIISHWQVPHQDIFPFANERLPWSCNNEWLGSVVLYLIAKAGGMLGLKVFRPLFFIFNLGILFCYSYRKLPFPLLLALAVLATLGLADRSALRPDIFNVFFIQIFLINLLEYEASSRRQWLYVLPFLSLFWFNIHMGAFTYGMPLLFIFLLAAVMRYFNLKAGQTTPLERINAFDQIKDYILTTAACLAVFMANPYGWEGFLYPFKILFVPNYISFFKFAQFIEEMKPPGYLLSSYHFAYYFILLAGAFIVLFFNRRRGFTLTVLLAFGLFTFLYAQRNSTFFTLICAYVFVTGAHEMRLYDRWQNWRYANKTGFFLLFAIVFFLLAQITASWERRIYCQGRLVNYRNLLLEPTSDQLILSLVKNRITGPVFNQDILGGKIIWQGYPALRPFLDGRNVDERIYNNSIVILLRPQENWPKAEREYHFKIVILNSALDLELPLIKYLGSRYDWQLVSVNGPLVTYVKRGEFFLPRGMADFELSVKSQDISAGDLKALKDLIKLKNASAWREFLYPSAEYVDLFSDGVTYYRLGFDGAAISNLAKALTISHRPYMQNIAGLILKEMGK